MKSKLEYLKIIFFAFCVSNAQTGIEVNNITNLSSLLEFPSVGTKGLILPAITTLPENPSNGTFLLDKNDKKIKMFENGVWKNLSNTGNITYLMPYSGSEQSDNKTIIGSNSTNADGVLVLESKTKALILPKVSSPHQTVFTPYPGMMCYDSDRKAVAVFDGTYWNYWK